MSERALGKSLRISAGHRAFCPGITVAVQRDPGNLQAGDAALEQAGAVFLGPSLQMRKKKIFPWKQAQDPHRLLAQTNQRNRAGFLTAETDHPLLPVDVAGFEIGNVRLSAAQMPAQLVISAMFRVLFAGDDGLMFRRGDRSLLFEPQFGPLLLGQDRPGQPIHVEGEIMNSPKENVGGDRARFQNLQKMCGICFQDRQAPNQTKRFVFHGRVVPFKGGTAFGFSHPIHRHLPRALGDLGINCGQISPRNVQVQGWLPEGFIFDVKQGERFGFISRAKTRLLSGGGILSIKRLAATKQNKPLVHNSLTNYDFVRSTGVSEQWAGFSGVLRNPGRFCFRRDFTDTFTDSGPSAPLNSLLHPQLGLVPVVGLEPTRLFMVPGF